jgi:Phosphotransferase enzyme family
VVVDAAAEHRFAVGTLPADVAVVWGRLPNGSQHPLRQAAERELDLRALRAALPPRLHIAAVHRLPAPGARAGMRGRTCGVLRAGIVVEVGPPDAGPRILDAVAQAARAEHLERPVHAGAGGTVLVGARMAGGARGLLRVTRAGASGDPATLVDTLERLATAGVPLAPRPLGRGVVAGASWTAEELLPGQRPGRITPDLVHQAALACGRLPISDGVPTAPVEDLLGAAAVLPRHDADLRRLADRLRSRLDGIRAVQRHGDLWPGNLLVDRGRLTGIIDWDAAHCSGVPGADLVQLVGTDVRRRRRLPLGRAVLELPWRESTFTAATAAYWWALDITPRRALVDIAGIAWWASEIHHTLVRFPQRRTDERWVAENVTAVLEGLERRRPDQALRRGSQRSISRRRTTFHSAASDATLTRQK